MAIDPKAIDAFSALIGMPCCRQSVGRGRSLSIGFGGLITHPTTNDPNRVYGEWEVGTYSSAWRIVRNGKILCGSADVVDSIDELDQRLRSIRLGAVTSIEELSQRDIRVSLQEDIHIDFICVSSESDETFHVFTPDSLYVEYKWPGGWVVGRSDAPWC